MVFDARGHLLEPHTGERIDLGTVGVREYIDSWEDDFEEAPEELSLDLSCPTAGPSNRYRFVLFTEKEGFNPLLEKHDVGGRYDLPIMSTKGLSPTAARRLAERWSEVGVTILVLHDFDKSGFSILHTLQNDTRRYRFRTRPKVIDLGLRLHDVRAMNLEDEVVEYKGAKKDPRIKLREYGATAEECDYLVGSRSGGGWVGRRVELNAMVKSSAFMAFLERQLEAHGVTKVIPSEEVLQKAFRLAWRKVRVQEATSRAAGKAAKAFPVVPPGLAQRVAERIAGTGKAWDEAIVELVLAQRRGRLPPGPT
jgi:hypothetical protein